MENFLESIKGLPNDIERNMMWIRNLDQHVSDLEVDLESRSEKLLRVQNISDVHVRELEQLRKLQSKLHILSLEKIALAEQAHETLTGFVTRLEEDFPRFESDGQVQGRWKSINGRFDSDFDEDAEDGADGNDEEESNRDDDSDDGVDADDNDDVEEEKVFCSCRKVSFGEMILCEAPSCRYKWFHLGCVNMKRAPKGRWYCPECVQNR